jgi:membrane-bound ClpP family serine protease
MALIGLAVVLFVAEVFWRAPLVAGMAATVALTFGFCLLFAVPQRIPMELAIPVSLVFGGITSILAYGAKRARRNKWADLQGRK